MKDVLQGEAYHLYDEMLDEVCDPVCIGSPTYSPSYVLKLVDPIAYRTGFWDWVDSAELAVH